MASPILCSSARTTRLLERTVCLADIYRVCYPTAPAHSRRAWRRFMRRLAVKPDGDRTIPFEEFDSYHIHAVR